MSDINELYRRRVIDNRQIKMVDAISMLLKNGEIHTLNIAVGYFYLSGLLLVKDEFIRFMTERNGQLNILMGNETNAATQQLLSGSTADYFEKLPQRLSVDVLDVTDTEFLQRVGQWIKEHRIEVKVYTGDANYFHAKSYLFSNQVDSPTGYAITGSSNFSVNGLEGNTELNVLSQDNFLALKDWFNSIWNSDEVEWYDEKLINAIQKKVPNLAKDKLYTPVSETYFDYASLFGVQYAELDNKIPWVKNLYPHQKTGVVSVSDKLNSFGTAVLSDGVGLGKTRTTAGVIRLSIDKGTISHVLLIADAKLKTQWIEEMATVGVTENYFDQMTRQAFTLLKKPALDDIAAKYDMIVIDEAHLGFKSRKAKAYTHIQYVFQKSKYHIKGLLLTATPWNNSREDVINLGSLFLSPERIPSDRLYSNFFQFGNTSKVVRELDRDNAAFNQFWDDLFLQRTRKTYGGQQVEYAERKFPSIDIPYEPRKNQLFSDNFERIANLTFPYMDPIRYIADGRNQIGLDRLKMILLKRADSSWVSYRDSLGSIITKLKGLRETLQGVLAQPKMAPRLKRGLSTAYKLDEYDDINLGGLYKSFYPDEMSKDDSDVEEVLPSEQRSEKQKFRYYEKIKSQIDSIDERTAKRVAGKMAADTERDLTVLEPLLSDLKKAYSDRDEKFDAVKSSLLKELSRGRKVILVSQFKTTADYYFTKLQEDGNIAADNIGLVTGGDDANRIGDTEITRKEILDRFSPRSKNRDDLVDSSQEINLLIGTDTISTGQNLQDAQVIMNLDLPYNPMILEQRIGRIDRPRDVSKTKSIYVYTFPVYQAIDAELKMTERLGNKMKGVMSDTQFDSSVLPNDDYVKFLRTAKEKHGDAVKTMLDDTVNRTIVDTGLHAEHHTQQYQISNKRMYDTKTRAIVRVKDPVVRNVSFSTGKENGVAVAQVIFKDVNSAELGRVNVVINLDTMKVNEVTNGEMRLHKALTVGVESTSQLDESKAKLLDDELRRRLRLVLKAEVTSYNKNMEDSDHAMAHLKDKVAEKAAAAIKESTTSPDNQDMIKSAIAKAGQTPKIVGDLVRNILTIDKSSALYDDVKEIANDVELFWLHFDHYAQVFDVDNIAISGGHQVTPVDIRKASEDDSDIKLLLANIDVSSERE